MSPLKPEPISITRSSVFANVDPALMRKEHLLASIALVAFSMLGMMASGAFAFLDWQDRQTSLRTEAEVIELQQGKKQLRAIVQYVDSAGVTHKATAVGPFNDIQAQVGQRIPIFYRPEYPESVSHDDPGRRWLGLGLFAGMASLPLLALPFMWRQVRKQEQRFARLRQLGLKRRVDAIRTESFRDRSTTRWAIVATWRDGVGRPHETLAGPYSRDPGPYDAEAFHVLDDPNDWKQAIIAPELLPATDLLGNVLMAKSKRASQ